METLSVESYTGTSRRQRFYDAIDFVLCVSAIPLALQVLMTFYTSYEKGSYGPDLAESLDCLQIVKAVKVELDGDEDQSWKHDLLLDDSSIVPTLQFGCSCLPLPGDRFGCLPTGAAPSLMMTLPTLFVYGFLSRMICTANPIVAWRAAWEIFTREAWVIGLHLRAVALWPMSWPSSDRRDFMVAVTQCCVIVQGYLVQYGLFGRIIHQAMGFGLLNASQLFYEEFDSDSIWHFLVLSQAMSVSSCLCLHRYFAHNCFETSRVMQFVLAILGTFSMQRGALWWAGIHRNHHVNCDAPDDIHSPRVHGFLYAHIGWLTNPVNFKLQMQNLEQYRQFPELFLVEIVNLPLSVYLHYAAMEIAGSTVVVCAFAFSVQAEWGINSFCHANPFSWFWKSDPGCHSRDLWWLGVVNAGEGFHGAHHDSPGCAHHGRRHWYNFDLTYLCILILEKTGLIWNVQHADMPDTRKRLNISPSTKGKDDVETLPFTTDLLTY